MKHIQSQAFHAVGGKKRSYILQQTCSLAGLFKLWPFVTTRHEKVKTIYFSFALVPFW